jgi:DNA-binding MarR family transcriptional regulator
MIQAYCGKDWTMPSQQIVALLLIMQHGELSLTEVKEKANIAQPSGTRALDVLQSHGLIETWVLDRNRMAGLTSAGKTLAQEIAELQ